MKFRYKVLIINIILLSIGIGTVGYFMIDKNVNLAIDSEIKNAIDENNMLQSAVEYELIGVANSDKISVTSTLNNVSAGVTSGMSANQSEVYIYYDNTLLYTNASHVTKQPENLINNATMGQKDYIISHENNEDYIYVTSYSRICDANLNIVNKRNITDVYNLIGQQIGYFRILLLIILLFCSTMMYIVSRLLTNPLEKLTKVSLAFGNGDYSVRSDVKTKDEVGKLSTTYNYMAQSVADHVDALEDMIKRQDQFVADFTHEIKTPMTTIIGYADTIRSRELSREKQIESASYIFSEGKRLESMSMKLFDLIYTKQHEINKKEFWVSQLMEEVSNSIEPALIAKNIKLETSYDNTKMIGDIDLLKSAFINLIDNARKASKQESSIIFKGEAYEDGYKISVKDCGTGISKEHISHITDAFYMIDKSRSRKEGGAGLGLSLASLIFKSHNADFNIDSTLGEGTCITLTFPEKNLCHIEEKEDDSYEE